MNTRGFDTRALHAGRETDPATGAASVPIHQTSSYEFESAEQAAELYALDRDEHMYSRISNPTTEVLERRLASLHGGSGACATASGMAAFDAATLVLAEAGDNVVSASSIYGGTHAYLNHTAARRGIETRFVDTLDPEAYEAAIDDDTAYVHVETIGNPALVTPPFEEIAAVAHAHDVPLFVDNTFATPALCRPLEHGADIVWASTTKWIHGSGTTVGGILIDGGEFDWHAGDYPELTDSPAFDGLDFTERFGDRAFEHAVRQRGLRSLGDQQSPFDAWATLQGVQTLGLRMERHCENALAVAEYLDDHGDVAWVNYPGLDSHETHGLASEYLSGYGGMVAFGLTDGYEGGTRVCESVEVATFLANVGDARTLVIHPASTTHAQLSESEQRASGVTPDLLRLSVGIEESEDIIADLEAAI